MSAAVEIPLQEKKNDNDVSVAVDDASLEGQVFERTPEGKTLGESSGSGTDSDADPNLDPNEVQGEGDYEEDSPYPEVRSAVANTDDPSMPCNTIRAWVIGLIWAIIIPGLNQYVFTHMYRLARALTRRTTRFFFFRYPSVTIGSLVAQLLSFPLGRAAAYILPKWHIFGVPLNPGPFTIKE